MSIIADEGVDQKEQIVPIIGTLCISLPSRC